MHDLLMIGGWVATIAALGGQQWSMSRSLTKQQDRILERLDNINGRARKVAEDTALLCGEVHSLPCKEGRFPAGCPAIGN